MHYVCLLRSISDDGFYIGYSTNLRKRFEQHAKGDAFATSYRGPWRLIYCEAYLEQADARGREPACQASPAHPEMGFGGGARCMDAIARGKASPGLATETMVVNPYRRAVLILP